MKIEVKIKEKKSKMWSLPITIDEFIKNPDLIEFEWEDGSTLPFNDFLFCGSDYCYGIFINETNIKKIKMVELVEKDVE